MKIIDQSNWNRKSHFDFFRQLTYPHFNLCANMDITEFYRYIKENNKPFFISFLYVVSKAANEIPEFRYRIRDNDVIEHERVNPAITIMTEQEVCRFLNLPYVSDYQTFFHTAQEQIEKGKKTVQLEDVPGEDDVLYMTSIPWVSFTSITHPIQLDPVDCIPRIAWGKFFSEGEKVLIPLSVQAHHALMDGAQAGKYFQLVQEIVSNPEKYLL